MNLPTFNKADVIHECSNFRSPLLTLTETDSNLNIIQEDVEYSSCNEGEDFISSTSQSQLHNASSSSTVLQINTDLANSLQHSLDESRSQVIPTEDVSVATSLKSDGFLGKKQDDNNVIRFSCEEKAKRLRRQKNSPDTEENEPSVPCVTSESQTSRDNLEVYVQESVNSSSIFAKPNLNYSPVEDMMNGNPPGWATVRKKLPNIAALQRMPINSRRHSKRSVVEQESFLEKFSTREYKHEHRTASYGQRRMSRPNLLLGVSKTQGLAGVDKPEKVSFSTSHESAISLVAINEDKGEGTFVGEEKFSDSGNCGFWFNMNFWSVIEPHCNIIYYWQYILMMAIHYNAWIVICRISFFDAQAKFAPVWFALDYIGDLIYIFDMLICMRITFLENGIYVTELRRVALRYIVSFRFVLDSITLLPLDLLYIKYGPNPILRLPRLIKFYKVFQSRKMIESLTSIPNIIRALFLLHLMFLLIHWNGCLYFMISKAEGFGSNTWVYPKLVGRQAELVKQYVHCYYWATLSLTTIGEGRGGPITVAENIYMIVCYITGIFIFATIVGQAGSVIQNMNASRMDFEKQRDNTMQYMKSHNVPEGLQRRVRLWYDYSYSRGRFQGGTDINEMTLLPNKMKTELALHVHLETLRKVSFLQKVQPDFLHDLVLKMKLHIFTPGDYICKKGEIAREMYVISDGILEVVSETGTVLKVLYPGNFFGEIGILSLSGGQNRRTADVRCCGYVELFVLSKDDVLSAIRDYPETQKILSRYGQKRLNRPVPGANGPQDATTSDSDEEEKGAITEEITNAKDKPEDLQPHNTTVLQSSRHSSPNSTTLLCRKDSEASQAKVTKGSVTNSSAHSSIPSSPDKSEGMREQSPSSIAVNMAMTDVNPGSPVQGSKTSIQQALYTLVNPVLGPASPTIAKRTPPVLRRKKFSESRSSSSPSLKKKRLSQPSIMLKRDFHEDITTGFFHSRALTSFDDQKDRKFFRRALTEAHFEALHDLEANFVRKVQKEYQKLRERVQELEALVASKDEEIIALQCELRGQLNQESVSGNLDIDSTVPPRTPSPPTAATTVIGVTEKDAIC